MENTDEIRDIEEHLKKQDDALADIGKHLQKQDRQNVWVKWFSVACIGISVIILGQSFRLGQQDFEPIAAQVIDYFLFAIGILIVGFAAVKYNKQLNKGVIDKSKDAKVENMKINSLDELVNKMEEWRKEDKIFALAEKFEHIAYIGWGFTIAMLGIFIANPKPINGGVAIAFLVMGFIMLAVSIRIKMRIKKK